MNTPIHPEFTGNTEGFASFKWPLKLFKGACQLPAARDPGWTCNRKSCHVAGTGQKQIANKNEFNSSLAYPNSFFFFLISFNSFRIFYFPRKQFQFLFRFYSILRFIYIASNTSSLASCVVYSDSSIHCYYY